MQITAICTENGAAVFPLTSKLTLASGYQTLDCDEVPIETLKRLTGLQFIKPPGRFKTQGLISIEVGDFNEDVDRGQIRNEKILKVVLHPSNESVHLVIVDKKLIKPPNKLQPGQVLEQEEALKDLKFLTFARANGTDVSQLIVTCRLDHRKKEEFTIICALDLPTDEDVRWQEDPILLSAYAEKAVSQQVHELNGKDKDVDSGRKALAARARLLQQRKGGSGREESNRFLELLALLESSNFPNEADIEAGYLARVEIIYDTTRERVINWCKENNHQLASDFGRNPTLITNKNRDELCRWGMSDESRHHKFSHGLGANPNIVTSENIDKLIKFAKDNPRHQFSQGLARNPAILRDEFGKRESLVSQAERQPGTGNEKHPFARGILAMNTLIERQETSGTRVAAPAADHSTRPAKDVKAKDDPDLVKRVTYLEEHPAATLNESERGYFQRAKISTNELRGRICTWLIDNYNCDYAFEFGCNEGLPQGEFREFLINLIAQEDGTYRTSNFGEALGGNPEIITDNNLPRLIACVQRYPDDKFSIAFGNNTELIARITTYLKARQLEADYLDEHMRDLVDWAQLNEYNKFAQAVLSVIKEHEISVRKEAKSFGNKVGLPAIDEPTEGRELTPVDFKRSTTSGKMSLKEVVRKVVEKEKFTSQELSWFCIDCDNEPSASGRSRMQAVVKEVAYLNTAIAQYLGWKSNFLITSSNVLDEITWAKQNRSHNYAIGIATSPSLFDLLGEEGTQKLISWVFENSGGTFSSTIQKRALREGLIQGIIDKAIHEGKLIPKRIFEGINLNDKKVRKHVLQLAMEGKGRSPVAYSFGYKFGNKQVGIPDDEMNELQTWCDAHKDHDLSKGFKHGMGVHEAELQRQQEDEQRAQGVRVGRGRQSIFATLLNNQ